MIYFSILVFISSCDQNNGVTKLTGHEWVLKSIEPKDEDKVQVNKDEVYTLEFFEDYTITGQVNCNILSAYYESDKKENLKFKMLTVTEKYCGDYYSHETLYLSAINITDSFQIVSNELVLFYEDGKSKLVFK
ncbi:MAG: META domain-containing protein [Candidatus Marinimicrobia bacterium]|nr:META domain-containing protein [Candidatus Neomarinimicrobiota bacterium]MBL7029636.1 META domain-containing protein [Candidatus Neomarinimicrobiota bacterium]